MSVDWPVTEEGSIIIRQIAVFDLKSFPKFFHNWAEENKYIFNESEFTEKVKGDGREEVIKYELKKKNTSFIRARILITAHAWRVNDVKVEDKIMQKGELEILFDATMEMDWQEKWESNPLTKFLRYIYIYYMKKQYFLDYAGKIWTDVYGLHAKLKTHLNQHVFL